MSAEANWRRSITDPLGQIFTPFFSLRADVASVNLTNQPGVSNFIETSDSRLFRGMPVAGLEYRYPLINVQSWGTNTIEPIAQIIARPERNADRQAPQRRRIELRLRRRQPVPRRQVLRLGPRVKAAAAPNYGLQYTAQFNLRRLFQRAVRSVLPLFGHELLRQRRRHQYRPEQRSRHAPDPIMSPASVVPAGSHLQVHHAAIAFGRRENFEVQAVRTRGHCESSPVVAARLLYGNYAAPAGAELGFLTRREGILGGVSYKFTAKLGRDCGSRATTSRPTSSTRPGSASAMSTIAFSWP